MENKNTRNRLVIDMSEANRDALFAAYGVDNVADLSAAVKAEVYRTHGLRPELTARAKRKADAARRAAEKARADLAALEAEFGPLTTEPDDDDTAGIDWSQTDTVTEADWAEDQH